MSNESVITKKIWLELCKICTLFRHNVGVAYIGERPISVGLSMANTKPVRGVADLIGWTPITITNDMVGRTVAIFTSIECKNSSGGRKSEAQLHWMNKIKLDGGIAGFAKSPEEAKCIIDEYRL